MARSNGENGSQAADQTTNTLTFQADGAERIDLPSTDFIAEASMTRQGGDLVLQTPDGQTVVIEGYFNADPAPVLHGPDGSVLTSNLVDSFVRSPLEFAAGQTANDESPVGAVDEVKGNATVTRADGTVETITNGTPIYQGDIIETDASGAVNIVFLDETSMAVSANARLAIDEYTFDPATESGTTNFSVLRGLFVFTSGLIGRDDPDDVKIETPVGSIGIRGTIIAGEINPGGESKISVLEGAIVIKNSMGEVTLSDQFETVSLSGYDQPMQNIGVQSASDIGARFSSIGDVNPSLFSVIGESAKEQTAPTQTQEAPKVDSAPEQQSSSSTQEHSAQSPTTATTTPAPVQAPDVFASVTDAPPSLHTETSSGLPSSTIVTGQPSGGLVDAGASPSITAPTTPMAALPPTSTAPSSPSTGSVSVTTPATPPPVLEANAPTQPVNSATFTYSGGTITDVAAIDTVVGRVAVSNGTATSYTFADSGTDISGNGYYRLVDDGQGGINVVLTYTGVSVSAETLGTPQLGGFEITAELEDAPSITQSFSVLVTDANAATRLNLDEPAVGVAIITDNFNDGSGGGRGFGYTIAALGDTNGDGFDDFIISNGLQVAGNNNLYRLLGSSTLYTSNDLSHASIAPTITPIAGTIGASGETTVHAIGDFNGDGITDYVVGQPYSNAGGVQSGNAFIVSGANSNMYLGFTTGLSVGAEIGYSVSGILDFNNDGHADVIIGAPGADRVFLSQGYTMGSWTGGISPSNFVDGVSGSDFGRSITGIGDFDGDGYSDFAVGAPAFAGSAGAVYIYSGNANGSVGTPLHTINGTTGEMLGTEVTTIGDFNGDGLTDLLIAGENSASVVFGTDGTAMRNMTFHSISGYNIIGGGGIGDFNGDGYDDFVISLSDGTSSYSYVVFGQNLAADQYHEIDSLHFLKNPYNAMEIHYSGANITNGLNVSSIGDINGDGYDDFAIGLPDANGDTAGDGGIAIIYGRDTGAVATPGATTAMLDNQVLVGSIGNDSFYDGSMTGTSMRGGAGADAFHINNMDFRNIDGGAGHDMIVMAGVGRALDFSGVDFERISRIEAINFGEPDQTMTLSLENLFNLMKSSDTGELRLANLVTASGSQLVLTDGDGFDNYAGSTNTVAEIASMLEDYSGSAITTGTQTTEGVNYNTFQIGGYMLLIDQAVTVDAQ